MSLDILFNPEIKTNKSYLIYLLDKARKEYHSSNDFMDVLIEILENDEERRMFFIKKVSEKFYNINFIRYLVDSSIHDDDGVLSVFKSRIGNLILPEIEDNNELTSLVNAIFYDNKRYEFVRTITKDRWEKFFAILTYSMPDETKKKYTNTIKDSLQQAMIIITDRIIGGFSSKQMMRYSSEGNYINNSFSKLSIQINNLAEKPDAPFDLLAIKENISVCRKQINDILTQKDYKGISLHVASTINRLQKQLNRLQYIIVSYNDLRNNGLVSFYANATNTWPSFYSPRKWMSNHLSSTLYLITFLVTYHNGKTGEKYITTTSKEYIKMFWTACWGGLIVAILCFIKTAIGNVENASPFFKAFFYSINYAIGFTTIYLLHWTLATKQPSMTAARLATAFKPQSGTDLNVKEFTKLFSQLCRSQLIAFIGNVIAGFGFAMLIFLYLNKVLELDVLKYSKAYHYWEELVVMDPQIFYFGSIAGVFLFISGLVSGITINNQRFNNIPDRIYHHPVLTRFFGEKKRRKISNWVEKNNGGVVGNVVFGFLMGFAFVIGEVLGIPFDIRHITFSAGNFAIGIGGMDYHFSDKGAIFIGFVSIFLIGWFNFIVSFTLSLFLAFRSNNIPFYKVIPMLFYIIKAFFKNPLPFFIPPLWTKSKEEGNEEIKDVH